MRLAGKVQICDHEQNVIFEKQRMAATIYTANGEDFLVLHSPHFKPALKYKLVGNVSEVTIAEFHREELTIKLKEPSHTVILYNCRHIIICFSILVKFLCNEVKPSKIVRRPLNRKLLARFKKLLNNLPENEEALKLVHLQMDYLPDALARLQHLIYLEIIHSNLTEMPAFIGALPHLTVLKLPDNKLGIQSNWEFLTNPIIRENLTHLDLQKNEIQTLPSEILNLHSLTTLHLDYNHLVTIPDSVLQMRDLRQLTVTNNRIRLYPYNLFPSPWLTLDLTDNPFTTDYFVTLNPSQNIGIPTLKELASRVVKNYRIPVTPATVSKTVYEYLRGARLCEICTSAYFDHFFPCRIVSQCHIYVEIESGTEDLYPDKYIVNMCSRKCMQPELKTCELLSNFTDEQYEAVVNHFSSL